MGIGSIVSTYINTNPIYNFSNQFNRTISLSTFSTTTISTVITLSISINTFLNGNVSSNNDRFLIETVVLTNATADTTDTNSINLSMIIDSQPDYVYGTDLKLMPYNPYNNDYINYRYGNFTIIYVTTTDYLTDYITILINNIDMTYNENSKIMLYMRFIKFN